MHEIQAKSILSAQNGMNLYRGCTHGCIYCDSRSRCYQMDHDFEDVAVKQNAPMLLEEALRRKRKRCMIGTGTMCDPYLPLEKELKLSRTCLELIERYGFGSTVLTKSDLVLRDLDLLQSIHHQAKCVVQMTLTCCDETLSRILEPRVCTTARRIEVLQTLRQAGIPTVVWLSPILPFLTDSEENMQGILDACFQAQVKGIMCFGMGMTLREGNREYFYKKLDEHFPGMRRRYERAFGKSYVCASLHQKKWMALLHRQCEARGILHRPKEVFSYLQTMEEAAGGQLSLF